MDTIFLKFKKKTTDVIFLTDDVMRRVENINKYILSTIYVCVSFSKYIHTSMRKKPYNIRQREKIGINRKTLYNTNNISSEI